MPKALPQSIRWHKRPSWRDRYDDLERHRADLLARLTKAVGRRCEEKLRRTAMTLINEKYRGATVAQRGAILASAEWLARMIEITG